MNGGSGIQKNKKSKEDKEREKDRWCVHLDHKVRYCSGNSSPSKKGSYCEEN